MSSSSPSSTSRTVTSRKIALRILGVILCVVVLVFTYQAVRTALALRTARAAAAQFKQEIGAGDLVPAKRSLQRITTASRTAHANSDNLLWDAAAHVPWAGRNVEAVQVVSAVLDDTSHAIGPSGLRVYAALAHGGLRADDGSFDLAKVTALRPALDRVSQAGSTGRTRMDRLDAAGLVSPLGKATAYLQRQFRILDSSARAGRTVASLLPAMLGAQSPRTYLLVVQNNAEIRASGGLPGSFSVLRATGGKLNLRTDRSGVKLPILARPVLPLSAEELALYGEGMGKDARETNLTPDFPRTAALLSAMYSRAYGEQVDGVVSVDPVALAMVLKATGPVEVEGESVGADNVVAKLLNRTYLRFATNDQQNIYFARAARDIFHALLSGPLDEQHLIRELAHAAGERRLLVWSRHGEEQRQISGTAASGELPEGAKGAPQVGLYLNDVTAGKMEYYLTYTGSVRSVSCAKGVQTVEAGLALRSSAPRAGRGLPDYVTGLGGHAPKGTMRMILRIYGPHGGSFTALKANERPVKLVTARHRGRPVATLDLQVAPGEELRLSATMRTAAGQRLDPELQWTPGMLPRANGATANTSCHDPQDG